MSAVPHRAIEDYIQYWETVNVRSVRLLEKLAVGELAYTDPFHDVRGIDAVEDIVSAYVSLRPAPKIKVSNVAASDDGMTVFLRWEAVMNGVRIANISGMSEIVFDADGKVIAHHNFWDSGSQMMARPPVLKMAYAWLKRRFQ